ncbi:hypothetical protein [Roseovarius sp.]|uniref:hypothetical protein n=1 Tax=Roseovarius sp. TaxID=1486281 RepID=UPI003A96ED45
MAIPLRADLVRKLIANRFGSVDNLVVEWEERVRSGAQLKGRARNRGTIYRWLDEGLPSRKEDVLGFAALLDVDPVALLLIDEDFVRTNYGRERRLFQVGALGRSQLAAFWALYVPGGGWPDISIAKSFYGREWTTHDYCHDPMHVSNVYACFSLSRSGGINPAAPWVVHFAYRRINARDGMWRPYGTVIISDHSVQLISESGATMAREYSDEEFGVPVETHFGPGGAEFRVASLHQFDLSVSAPSHETDSVRFEA